QVEGLAHGRVQLAGVAHDAAVDHDPGAAARVPGRQVALAYLGLGTGRLDHGTGRLHGVGPVGGAARTPPAGRLDLAGQHGGDVPRLVGQGRLGGGEVGVGGPVVHAHR